MTELLLYAPDVPTLTMLAQRLDGVPGLRIVEERRRHERRVRQPDTDHAKRSGTDRRAAPWLKGGFALVERS